MAGIPLNTFRTVTKVVPQASPAGMTIPGTPPYNIFNPYYVYSAPPGTTGIILYCQVANVGNTNFSVSMWHYRPGTGVFTEIVRQVTIPPNDVMVMIDGKLVLETYDILFASGSSGTSSLKMIASVLESANQ